MLIRTNKSVSIGFYLTSNDRPLFNILTKHCGLNTETSRLAKHGWVHSHGEAVGIILENLNLYYDNNI